MKKGSIRKTSLAGLVGIIMVLAIFGGAYGYGSYYTQFNTMYGGAGAMMNSCGVCHIDPGGGGPRTLYGEDVFTQLSAGAAIAAALTAVEPHDPDGDTFTNIQEITARTNPSDPASHPTAPPPPPVTAASAGHAAASAGHAAASAGHAAASAGHAAGHASSSTCYRGFAQHPLAEPDNGNAQCVADERNKPDQPRHGHAGCRE